jgi:Steigviridae/Suoliviridae L,D-carboxypeptidase/transpeptidase
VLISIRRKTYTDQSTQGEMYLNGTYECFTLEPRKDQSQGKPYCVPAGLYDYGIHSSPRFGRNVIRIQDISGFDDIEIHPGNFPRDTHGCCLVGRTKESDFVGQSDVEFDSLLAKIPPVGSIEYVDAPVESAEQPTQP